MCTCTAVAVGDDQKQAGPGTSIKSKHVHTRSYSYCCSRQHRISKASSAERQRLGWLEERYRLMRLSVRATVSIQDKV